jgi:uncharacterized protein YndB with AHSA1/START domain
MRRYERHVEIDAPVGLVFDMFADFERAPRWMGGVRDVWRAGRGLTHWVAETALDFDVEWDAEVAAFEPGRRVVWRSVAGDVRADCEADFSVTPRRTTLLRVVRGFATPGGRTGREVALFFGARPGLQLEEDLARFRRMAERAAHARRADFRGPRAEEESYGSRRRRRAPRAEDAGGESYAREPRPRHALTPREREQERERERETRRDEEERRAAGWYLRRGIDRLLEPAPRRRQR